MKLAVQEKKRKKEEVKVLKRKLIMSMLVAGLIFSLSGIASAEKVKITVMWCGTTRGVMEPLEIAFEKEFPNYDLTFVVKPPAKAQEALWAWAIAGQLPDIFSVPINWTKKEWIDAGMIIPIDDLVRELNLDLSVYPDWSSQLFTWEGKLYGLPNALGFAGGFINYNKKVFDEAGISYPTSGMTWEELADLARKLTVRDEKGKITRYGIFCKWPTHYLFTVFGGRVVDDPLNPKEMLFGHTPYLTGVQWYRDLVDEGVMMDRYTYDEWGGSKPKLFFEERFAMIITAVGYGGSFKEVDYDVEILPLTAENIGYSVRYGQWNIGSQSENPKAALEFAYWYHTSIAAMEVWQAYVGDNGEPPLLQIPELQDAYEKIAAGRKPENWKCVYDAIPYAVDPVPSWDGGTEIMATYWDAIMEVMLGKRPVSYLIEAEAVCQEMLDESNRDK